MNSIRGTGLVLLFIALMIYFVGLWSNWSWLIFISGVLLLFGSFWSEMRNKKKKNDRPVSTNKADAAKTEQQSTPKPPAHQEKPYSEIRPDEVKEVSSMSSNTDQQISVDVNLITGLSVLGGVRVSVPPGQVFVLSHGDLHDQSGFPEVYLAGETVEKNRHRKDVPAIVYQLLEYPGAIRCNLRQWLAGISISEEDVATLSLHIPLYLRDPIQTIRRAGEPLTKPDDRQRVNMQFAERVTHRLQAAFVDRIQLWSAEKREILDRFVEILKPDFEEWGLKSDVDPEKNKISMIRHCPPNLYEIVLQFSRAEQILLEGFKADREIQLTKDTGLLHEDLVAIQTIADQKDKGDGAGLFLTISTPPTSSRDVLVSWLKQTAGAGAENFVRELYYGKHSDADVKLSEQILLSAFRSPILGLGEWFDVNLDASIFTHYRFLAQNLDKATDEKE